MTGKVWRPLDAPSPYPVTHDRPSRCPDAEVVQVDDDTAAEAAK